MYIYQYKNPLVPDVKGYRVATSFLLDIAPLVMTAINLIVKFFIFKDFTPDIPLACGILNTALFMTTRGRKWEAMESCFLRANKIDLPAIIILMAVVMLFGSWIIADNVPTILYIDIWTYIKGMLFMGPKVILSVMLMKTLYIEEDFFCSYNCKP